MLSLIGIAPELAKGLAVTVTVTAGASVIALAAATAAGAARRSRRRTVRWLASLYIETFRGVPAIVQLFWLFYVLPLLGVTLSPYAVGIGGLGLCSGAYGAEIVRSALDGIPQGQIDAAAALGLRRLQILMLVVFVQAARIMLPQLGNLLVDLMKTSALVSLITLNDLTFEAQDVTLSMLNTAPVLLTALALYYGFGQCIVGLIRWLERRLSWPGQPA